MKTAEHGPDLASLQELVDSVPALIHTARPDGYIDFFNQRWLEYVGLRSEDLEGWKWTAAVHPDDVNALVAKWRACLASGEPFEFESRVRRADGIYRWMWHHKLPLRNASGEIVKWYGSSADIDDRKQAEFYLAEGQRLAHTGSWAFNAAGFEYWSPELFAIYGLNPGGKAPTVAEYISLVHPDDRGFVEKEIQTMLAEHRGFDFTKRIVRPDGSIRHVRCVGKAGTSGGIFQGFVGTGVDVTEHALLNQEIRRREAYLAEAQRLSHTGSFGWKPDSGEIVWSEETYRIFEYDSTLKPTVDSVVQRVHPDDRALAQQVIDRVSQTGSDFEREFRLLVADGRIKHVHAIAHAVRNASGECEFIGAVTDITERKSTEDKIRRLVEADILGIFIANVEGELVEANQAFLRMLQYDRQDLVSGRMRWTTLTPAELRERDERALREVLATGVFQPYEKEFLRKDGSRLPVLIGGALFQNANEGVVFVLDLSEQKRGEEALRRSESYLAEAQRLSQTGSWAWSPEEDIRYWSEECYRVLSFDPQNGLPRFEDFFQRLHPDDQPGFRELIQTAIREKAEWEADYRIVHPDGPVRDIHVVGHPVLSTSGDLDEFVGTVIDVTERKAAEEKIREQEMEFRQMLDLAPQQVAVFGPGGERLFANRAALDYVGLGLEEWRHTSGSFFRPGWFIHPDDRERVAARSDSALSSGSAYELEFRVRGADGNYRWFLVRYNPLHDDKGQVKRWYLATTDIDERKRAEERLQQENVALREEVDTASMFEEIVGASPALGSVLFRVSKVARSDSTVLITGETGTGKELVARAIHRRSPRGARPFVSVNCAAVPRELIASELFGHEKGAFTGATQRRLGRFELAHGGTIFLDEVGELPMETQVALLRVLQEREFERVGGSAAIRVDVRVIAATNRDLQAAIEAGTFRSDLFYRLNVFPITVPPLRERADDIPLLVEYFIDRYARKAGKTIRRVNKRTLDRLQSYPWPGNVRELQNVIERSVIVCDTDEFTVDDSWLSAGPAVESRLALSSPVAAHEKSTIEEALRASGGRVFGPAGAAARLGIARSTLESKIRALGINKNRFRGRPAKQ